ncbi:MAG: O-antigen ligase family protein [Planctomycetes bacterium]|nr:O-antigen ligase family protein [Planctomycetota bacterium]
MKETQPPNHRPSATSTLRRRSSETLSAPLWIVDGALAGTVFALPFVMGGRHPWGDLLLVLLGTVAAAAWMTHRLMRPEGRWVWTWAEPLLLLGAMLVLLQLVPLSESLLGMLSPRVAEILPLWTSAAEPGAAQGVWSQISLAPEATRGGLAVYLAYGMLFVVAVQRMRRLSDVERMIKWIACLAAVMATFGILQFITSNGKFMWVYEHPYRDTLDRVKGSFINHNHFAHLLALGIGPLIWWVQRSLRDHASGEQQGGRAVPGSFSSRPQFNWQIALPIAALAVVLFAGLMSLSRSGAVVMLLATLVCIAIYYRAKLIGRPMLLGIGATGCLVVAGLYVYGATQVSERLDDFAAGSIEQLDANSARRDVWAAVIQAIPDYWIAGSGVGSHQHVVPMYLERQREFIYSHAESSYLQIALETGLPGSLLVLCGIGLCGWWCIGGLLRSSSSRITAAMGAVAASLAASMAHSLVDFPWYIVGCMAITTLLLACCFRLWYFSRRGEQAQERITDSVPITTPKPRVVFAMSLLITLALGGWAAQDRFGPAMAARHWDQFDRMSMAAELAQEAIDVQFAKLGEEAKLPSFAERQKLDPNTVERKYEALQGVLRWNPDDGRAHLEMAKVYLSRFTLAQEKAENSMPASQIREAAIRSGPHFQKTGEKTLAACDADNDGGLDQGEVARVSELADQILRRAAAAKRDGFGQLKTESLGLTRDDAKRLANVFTNERGMFRTQEIKAAVKLASYVAESDRHTDHNSDGRLSADELGRFYLDEWLERAIDKTAKLELETAMQSARRALRLLPLEGSAYLFLAEMSFLQGAQATHEAKRAFIDQALLARPYDGNVLFRAGTEAMLDERLGGREAALVYWKKSFYTRRRNQRLLVDLLYTRVPPEFFIEAFEPDLPATRLIYSRYHTIYPPQYLVNLSNHYTSLVEQKAETTTGEGASRLWLECYRLYDKIGDKKNMIRCARSAVESDSNYYEARYVYGMRLLEFDKFEEAEKHIRWCVQRKPNDEVLRGTHQGINIKILNRRHGIESARKKQDSTRR